MENTYDYEDEAEETLSLSDYSINTTTDEGQDKDFSSQLQTSNSISSNQEHYFEFCSEEWCTSNISNPPENIIFCGKIISCCEREFDISSQNLTTITKENDHDDYKKQVESFRWNGSHNICTSRKLEETFYTKREEQKLQKLTRVRIISGFSSLGKLRWSLFFFGGTGFPKKMALRDIRSRQSRRSPSSTLFGMEGGDEKMINVSYGSPKNRIQRGLLGLLKALSCGGQQHANTVVKTSMGCFSRL